MTRTILFTYPVDVHDTSSDVPLFITSLIQVDKAIKDIHSFHALILIAWLADGDTLVCCIVMMGRQIAKMFSTFTL